MIDTNTIIHVRNLKKNYPLVKSYRELLFRPLKRKVVNALVNVDIDVKQGECFCLLGPNGAGKTTLIKILSTLVLPDDGEVYINGFDVSKNPEKARASIGFAVSEERSFYWRLTGRQNLDFYAALNNIPLWKRKKFIDEVLSLTNLEGFEDMRVNTYSTGMRQMMAFARALLTESQIIFVDEPTKSLDPQAADKVRRFLKEELVKKQGRTVFWATHNLAEAQEFGDRLAIIGKGRILIHGTVLDLTKSGELSLQGAYAQALKGVS